MSEEKDKIIIEVEEAQLPIQKKNTVRVLAFSLGLEYYCIAIHQAKEVLALPEITRIPNCAQFVTGVINLRGEIIALIDLRYFLGLGEREKNKEARVVITDTIGSLTAVLVDSVEGTVDIEERLIQPPLATLPEKVAVHTKGHVQFGNKILIFLDLEKVLRCEEIERLRRGEGGL